MEVHLPEEILLHVFDQLPVASLCQARLVCTIWQRISDDARAWADEAKACGVTVEEKQGVKSWKVALERRLAPLQYCHSDHQTIANIEEFDSRPATATFNDKVIVLGLKSGQLICYRVDKAEGLLEQLGWPMPTGMNTLTAVAINECGELIVGDREGGLCVGHWDVESTDFLYWHSPLQVFNTSVRSIHSIELHDKCWVAETLNSLAIGDLETATFHLVGGRGARVLKIAHQAGAYQITFERFAQNHYDVVVIELRDGVLAPLAAGDRQILSRIDPPSMACCDAFLTGFGGQIVLTTWHASEGKKISWIGGRECTPGIQVTQPLWLRVQGSYGQPIPTLFYDDTCYFSASFFLNSSSDEERLDHIATDGVRCAIPYAKDIGAVFLLGRNSSEVELVRLRLSETGGFEILPVGSMPITVAAARCAVATKKGWFLFDGGEGRLADKNKNLIDSLTRPRVAEPRPTYQRFIGNLPNPLPAGWQLGGNGLNPVAFSRAELAVRRYLPVLACSLMISWTVFANMPLSSLSKKACTLGAAVSLTWMVA